MMKYLHNIVERKFEEVKKVSKYSVLTETGFKPITHSNKTIKYEVYKITLENGLTLKCADTHILIDRENKEVFAKYSLGKFIKVKGADKYSKVIKVENLGYSENMYDLTVDSKSHTYYTNDILSHNTVTVGTYLCWKGNFNKNPINIGIVANKASGSMEVLSKIKNMYIELPFWMQKGIEVWNKTAIEFGDHTRIMCDVPSGDSFRGFTINYVYTDECNKFNQKITVRNKETGEIENITFKELWERLEN